MKEHATLTIISSRRDTFGNTYWAFRFVDHHTGCESVGTVSGGESNINRVRFGWSVPGEWDRGIVRNYVELGIRDFNRRTEDYPYAGSTPEEIAAYIRRDVNLGLANNG
jgi:hypothetical protein